MTDTNEMTLGTYRHFSDRYIENTPTTISQGEQLWIDATLEMVPNGGTVLEIGGAMGRDADYIQSKGYAVDRTDAVEAFVVHQNNRGETARVFNVITDEIDEKYSMVFAHAVFLHFTPEELGEVLDKLHIALEEEGVLAFSVKKGSGSGVSDEKVDAPRFFQYWEIEPLQEILETHGFEIEDYDVVLEEARGIDWLHVIAKPI